MTRLTLRAGITATLEALLPPGTVAYDHPAETVVLPAVVFVPRDPYWRPRIIGDASSGTRVEFDLQLLVPRTSELSQSLAELESLADTIIGANIGATFVTLSDIEPTKVNDLDALVARLAYAVTV